MKCKHCNKEMILDTGKILLSNPPKQVYICPKCGSIECVSLDDGSIFVYADEHNPTGVIGEIEIPLNEEMEIRADERKKVVEEIKKRLAKQRMKMQDNTHCYLQSAVYWQDIVAILDQVEKGENDE